jgi:hypothetical protein
MHIASIGIDLGKTTFHLVALGEQNKILLRRKFSRTQLLAYTANLPASLCHHPQAISLTTGPMIAMEILPFASPLLREKRACTVVLFVPESTTGNVGIGHEELGSMLQESAATRVKGCQIQTSCSPLHSIESESKTGTTLLGCWLVRRVIAASHQPSFGSPSMHVPLIASRIISRCACSYGLGAWDSRPC